MEFSPDGSKIVSGSADKTIKVWDSGARFSEIPKFEPILTVSASQCSYTRAEDRAEQRPQRVPISSVQFSPDGSKIVSGSYDQTIKVWDSGAFWA